MDTQKKVRVKLKIICTYSIAIAIACVLLYFIIPGLLNYGPDTINTEFDKQVSGGLYYYQQILLIGFSLVFVVATFLFFILKDIDSYPIYIENKNKYKSNIDYIKKVCLSLPNRLLVIFIVIPLLLSICVLFMQTSYLTSSDFKLMLVVFILSTTTISITNTYIRNVLSKILNNLENTSYPKVRRNSIVEKLLLQIIPIMAVCIVFTYLAVSSIYEKNNAVLLSNFYSNQFKTLFDNSSFFDENDLIDLLNKVDLSDDGNVLFLLDSDFNFVFQSGELSDFFKKYASELSVKNDFVVYDFYGSSGQGILFPVTLQNGQSYFLGASYIIYSNETIFYITSLLLGLGIICAIILFTFASEISKHIKEVTNSLKDISNNNQTFSEKKLYITSVDEIGDLIKEYNNIQALTINHLNQIHDNQETLMEKERLASLGQLIGGIAHNLKTPIMSISGASEGLSDLIKEYDSSIDDPEVNSQDHHDIASDMSSWVSKIKSHTEYMSDVITAVKGQAVNFANDVDMSFTVTELLKRVDILMKHELKNSIVYLKVLMNTDENIVINGDVNSLVQIINNMISNSIQAYAGKPDQSIDLVVERVDNDLLISVRDYACGLPDLVKNKLFKEMVTTKGKNGTGLGLYMSYSTIRAHFNGNILVDSEVGKGTTFTIVLPL